MRKKSEKEELIKKIVSCKDMLRGGIVRLKARCGKKGCRKCNSGEYHGISHYLSIKESGKTEMVYIPKSMVKEVEERTRLFKAYWELGKEVACMNLEEFKEKKAKMKGEKE